MACIYKIENLVNGKIYIGSTCNTLSKRKGEHISSLNGGYHFNKHLQRAWKKYGGENFKFSIIEKYKFPENYSIDNIYDYVTGREIFLINEISPEYNIMKEIRAGKLGREVTEEQKEYLRELFIGKTVPEYVKKKIRKARAKQIITEEHKRKISESLKGRKTNPNYKPSEEHKLKISKIIKEFADKKTGLHSPEAKEKRTATLKIKFNTPEMKEKLRKLARDRNRKSFLCFKNNEYINEFTNQSEAAQILNCKQQGISAVLNGEQKTHRGYYFKFKEN